MTLQENQQNRLKTLSFTLTKKQKEQLIILTENNIFFNQSCLIRNAVRFWFSRHLSLFSNSSQQTSVPDFTKHANIFQAQHHNAKPTKTLLFPQELVTLIELTLQFRVFISRSQFLRCCVQYWFEHHPYFFEKNALTLGSCFIEHFGEQYYISNSFFLNHFTLKNPKTTTSFTINTKTYNQIQHILRANYFQSLGEFIRSALFFWISRHVYYSEYYTIPKEIMAEEKSQTLMITSGKKTISIALSPFLHHFTKLLLKHSVFRTKAEFFRCCLGYWLYFHRYMSQPCTFENFTLTIAGRNIHLSQASTHAKPLELLRKPHKNEICQKSISKPSFFTEHPIFLKTT